MIHGFHRQCQPFQLLSGPPWIHSSSGAGVVAAAPSGSTSQARRGVPSVGGGGDLGEACRAARAPAAGGGSGTGTPGSGPSRTGAGGASTALRSAYTVPSGPTTGSVYAPSSSVSRVTVAVGEVDAEERRAAAVVGGHDEGRGVGRPRERR